jgi:hypothetical protein
LVICFKGLFSTAEHLQGFSFQGARVKIIRIFFVLILPF